MKPVNKLFAMHHLPSGSISENLLKDKWNFLQVTFKNRTIVYCLDSHKTVLEEREEANNTAFEENLSVYE